MTYFWIGEAIKVGFWYSAAYVLGLWVIRRGVRVNYTRKILFVSLFLLPPALAVLVPFNRSMATSAVSWLIFLACVLTLSAPFRSRSRFLATAFASLDRPEDRPYTLTWLVTQTLATYAALVVMIIWLRQYEKPALAYIMVLVMGIGDGLAEPVGVRFGRHKYRVRALFTGRTYTRSLEGSACVLLSGVLAVLIMHDHFTQPQFWLALLIVPPVLTIAEALSPHTWDGPFIYLAGGASTVGVLELSRFV